MKRKKETKNTQEITEAVGIVTIDPTLHDAMVALLIVSVTINLFILITWITLQVTSIYDAQVASFLFSR